MSFLEERVQRDIHNLLVPIRRHKFAEGKLWIEMDINEDIYRGTYLFRIDFPEDYPFESPKVFCYTSVYHPNIDSEGRVCLGILRLGWLPSYDLNSILVSIICMFTYVSGDDALNTEAGNLYEMNLEKFEEKVREVTAKLKDADYSKYFE